MNKINLELTRDELMIICNSLLNIDNELDDNEFHTLVGVDKPEARELFQRLKTIQRSVE